MASPIQKYIPTKFAYTLDIIYTLLIGLISLIDVGSLILIPLIL